MSDPVVALILIGWMFVAVAAVRFFKTLDSDFWQAAATPVFAGAAGGVLVRFINVGAATRPVVAGIVLTVAGLYARLTGEESEPVEGMLLGALSGAAAALPLVINTDWEIEAFAMCVVAGAVAGYGITFAAFHVADKIKQLALDAVTAAIAIGAAYVPAVAGHAHQDAVAISIAAIIPILGIAAVFKQWPDIRAELRHEASLGFIDDDDVRATAHPLLRLGRAGWNDSGAHRQFVRIANRIALRKRQQRNRPDEMARLYQLEIIKLRMELREMSRVDHESARRKLEPHEEEAPASGQ